MTTQKILESIQRADEKNKEPDSASSQNRMGALLERSQQDLTDADHELIESFLEVNWHLFKSCSHIIKKRRKHVDENHY